MLQFENAITIDTEKDKVFSFVSNPLNLPRWNYYVRRVDQLTGDGPEDGARFRQIRLNDEQELRITRLLPGEGLSLSATGGDVKRLERNMSFKAVPGGTRIVDDWKLSTGTGGLAERIFARKVRHAVHENLQKLKKLLEVGEVTLQDGRTERLPDGVLNTD